MPLSMAEVLADHWPDFARRYSTKLVTAHYRAVRAVLQCRTRALGGRVFLCKPCKKRHFAYHSCNHRSCPQCGAIDSQRWSARQEARLLPGVDYYLVTFTVPKEFRSFCKRNPAEAYDLMLRESAGALQDAARTKIGGRLGLTSILHTWGRPGQHHPHIHIIVPAVAFDDKARELRFPRNPKYLLSGKLLADRFRNRLHLALQDTERYPGLLAQISDQSIFRHSCKWRVHLQCAGRGFSTVRYLARYVQRTAFGPGRLLGYDEQGRIRLSWQNSKTKRWGEIPLPPEAFIKRFLTHVLPTGFMRIRHYGWLAGAARKTRLLVRALLCGEIGERAPKLPETPPVCCPKCGLEMKQIGTIGPDYPNRGPPDS